MDWDECCFEGAPAQDAAQQAAEEKGRLLEQAHATLIAAASAQTDSSPSYVLVQGEAGTGNVVEAVRHCRAVMGAVKSLQAMDDDELYVYAKEIRAPIELVRQVSLSRSWQVETIRPSQQMQDFTAMQHTGCMSP